jgi:hypothetical protein
VDIQGPSLIWSTLEKLGTLIGVGSAGLIGIDGLLVTVHHFEMVLLVVGIVLLVIAMIVGAIGILGQYFADQKFRKAKARLGVESGHGILHKGSRLDVGSVWLEDDVVVVERDRQAEIVSERLDHLAERDQLDEDAERDRIIRALNERELDRHAYQQGHPESAMVISADGVDISIPAPEPAYRFGASIWAQPWWTPSRQPTVVHVEKSV